MDRAIDVYADFRPGATPMRLGTMHVRSGRGPEIVEFAFAESALADATLVGHGLDPDLTLFAGPQYPRSGHATFGVFKDSSPDRWGETLIKRRFDRRKREGLVPANARLGASDYLLGVHDAYRSGALRFAIEPGGPFLDNSAGDAAPPFVRLRELEAASRAIESDPDGDDARTDAWLRLLLAPGASLGGARPKASIVDATDRLWIAKFPSVRDRHDVGAWELVVQRLARRCGLRVPESDARTFAGDRHTFMVRRFDRDASGSRVHFASAMTLTGHGDGDGASTGASYLEIAEVIASRGAAPRADLEELWSRIAFNVMVSNTDDHLRNHGFLLVPAGWRLSEAYDMNPVLGSSGLALNIDESDNALDLDLVRSVAPYFRVKDAHAAAIIERMAECVREWDALAADIGISRSERRDMADAFALAAVR